MVAEPSAWLLNLCKAKISLHAVSILKKNMTEFLERRRRQKFSKEEPFVGAKIS